MACHWIISCLGATCLGAPADGPSVDELIDRFEASWKRVTSIQIEMEQSRRDKPGAAHAVFGWHSWLWQKDRERHTQHSTLMSRDGEREQVDNWRDRSARGSEVRTVTGWSPDLALPLHSSQDSFFKVSSAIYTTKNADLLAYPREAILWRVYDERPLRQFVQETKEVRLLGKSMVGASEVWGLEVVEDRYGVKVSLYFDPSKEFVVIRRVVQIPPSDQTPKGESVTMTIIDHERIAGIWFPKQARITSTRDPQAETLVKLMTCKVNQPIDPKLFELKFPPGAKVSDQVLNRIYIWDKTGPKLTLSPAAYEQWVKEKRELRAP